MSVDPAVAGTGFATDSALLEVLRPLASDRSFPYFNLTGPGRDRALQLDRKVRQAVPPGDIDPDSAEYKRLLAAFIASPLTGCTTVLDQLRIEAKYNPQNPTQESHIRFFYMGLYMHPLFVPPDPVQDSFSFKSGPDKDPRLKELVERYKGTDATAAGIIQDQLSATLGLAVKTVGTAQETELISEYSLSVGTEISFSYLRSRVKISVTIMPPYNYWTTIEGGKGWIQFQFNQAKWPEQADAVLRKHLKLADDWLKP